MINKNNAGCKIFELCPLPDISDLELTAGILSKIRWVQGNKREQRRLCRNL